MTIEEELRTRCRVNTNAEGDTFVGIKSEGGNLSVCFPLGYSLPTDDKELRRDVIHLISVLTKFTDMKSKIMPNQRLANHETVNFPIQAYMTIISEYMNSGYYTENEVQYREDRRGKISWSRTIKTQKPLPQAGSFIYLDYVVKDTASNDSSLITLIHEYCVYESFQKLGWLYTAAIPQKPRLTFNKSNKNMFLSTIRDKLGQTFNDKSKELFSSMISMIQYLGENEIPKQFYFGTNRFEYVWERLIDYTFGVDSKERYFPRTTWHLKGGRKKDNFALEPDTVMICGNNVYVLDAKYYKYGVTSLPEHLPQSSSINKQITYGEYIATEKKFKKEFGQNFKVYNAFIMPFNKVDGYFAFGNTLHHIGEATGGWKNGGFEYEHVQGILLDVRHIMYAFGRKNQKEIIKLSLMIEQVIDNEGKEQTPSTTSDGTTIDLSGII